MTTPAMQLTEINGVNLELFDSGTGEPVMFIHGGGSIECHAVLQEPALSNTYRLIHFYRRGYGNSERPEDTMSFEQHSADCKAVLDELDVQRVHVVGESVGGSIALQFVVDYPDTVQSLALLEPVLPTVIGSSPEVVTMLENVDSRYKSGDTEGAVDTFFKEVAGDGYRSMFDQTLEPGWFEQLLGDERGMFEVDPEALNSWTFTAEDAARIRQPVLNLAGSDTRSFFKECHEAVKSWIPHAESVTLPAATHCMLETNPTGAADRLDDFFSRHPIAETSGSTAETARQRLG